MTDFVLVPGAGGLGTSYWHLVSAQLEEAGHRARPVELPGGSLAAGLPEYATIIVDAIEECSEPVVVAQSMGGFSAVMACERAPRMLILVNAMVPAPGETPGAWWSATGAVDARTAAAKSGGYEMEFDLATYFLHDLNAQLGAEVLSNPGDEADITFTNPCDITRWPDIATTAVVGRDDRFFPLEFQRRLLRQRIGVEAVVVPGGHLLALANPDGLYGALLDLTGR